MNSTQKILIMDDDFAVINALKRVLNKKHYEIMIATNSTEAMTIINGYDIDLLICDQNVPGITGLEVLKYSKEVLPNSIRILLTGELDLNLAVSAINEGSIYYYFPKPWDKKQLVGIVENALVQKKEHDKKDKAYNMLGNQRKNIQDTLKKLDSISILFEDGHVENQEFEPVIKNNKTKIREKYDVADGEDIIFIKVADIYYATAIGGQVEIVTVDNKYSSSISLAIWEARLKEGNFFKCHRSYLINLDKVEKLIPWQGNTYNIKLKNTEEIIPVSRSKKKELKTIMHL